MNVHLNHMYVHVCHVLLKGVGIINVNRLCLLTNEPPRGKTNNVVSELVRHKPACTSTEKS